MNQCNGICKNGKQCSRMLKSGHLCKQHFKGECSICLDTDKNDLIKTSCGHFFHDSCLQEWKQFNNTCPLCRYIISEAKQHKVSFQLIITPDNPNDVFSIYLTESLTNANDMHLIINRFYNVLIQDNRFKHIIETKQSYDISISLS